MPIKHIENQLVVPRGRLYLDLIVNGAYTGEIPFGNVPEFTVAISSSKAEHFSSETAETAKDRERTTRVTRSGKTKVDNIDDNMLQNFLGADAKWITTEATPVVGQKITVRPGRIFQLGVTAENPLGVKNISAFSIKAEDGITDLTVGVDYNVDPLNARLQILEGGLVLEGDVLTVGYTPKAGKRLVLSTGGEISKEVGVRLVPDNADGPNRDWWFPKVSMSPDGDFALINTDDDYIAMDFALEVLKPANGSAVYVGGEPITIP